MTVSSPPHRGSSSGATAFGLYALHLWAVMGIALSNLFLGLLLLVAPREMRRRRTDWSGFAPALAPLGLYALALLASIATSADPRVSLPAAREVVSLATLPLGLALLRGRARVQRVVDGLTVAAVASSVWGLAQLVASDDGVFRVRGPFSHYMTLAGFLLLVDLLVMARLACEPGLRRSLWHWAALVPINLAMVATLTRSAWVALFLGFTLLLLLRAPRYLALFLLLATLFVALAPAPVQSRVISTFNPRDITNYDRLCMAEAGVRMAAQHPLFGLGPRMVERLYPIYRHPTAPRQTTPHLHNSPLQLAAEGGLVSLGAYLWLMAAALWVAYRGYRDSSEGAPRSAALYLGAFLALLSFFLMGLFEDNWSDTEVQRIVLFLIAVPYALSARRQPSGMRQSGAGGDR